MQVIKVVLKARHFDLNALFALRQPFSTRVPRHPGGCLGKMSKNCPKHVHKLVGGTSLPFSYTKPRVFIVHHYDLLAAGVLTTNDIIS
ncbi:unnamed protein product [Staurois parvus]|uniref:Uncharacterized protein n=1 Tax=Staurois parvus TaxID=386267 RepID=A0ABN9FQI1_9NEOB|nr:unnamed protein product [Staurois parvus]